MKIKRYRFFNGQMITEYAPVRLLYWNEKNESAWILFEDTGEEMVVPVADLIP